MVSAWVYDHKTMNDEFDYNDLEKKYLEDTLKNAESPQSLKEQLDQAHKWKQTESLISLWDYYLNSTSTALKEWVIFFANNYRRGRFWKIYSTKSLIP